MSSGKRDFYAKEVTDAIKMACDALQTPQEDLAIEVVETGSMGIFGLIRKKAHIRASVKGIEIDGVSDETSKIEVSSPEASQTHKESPSIEEEIPQDKVSQTQKNAASKEAKKKQSPPPKAPVEIKVESVEVVRQQLEELLRHMGFPSEVTATLDGGTVRCKIGDEHEDALTGQDGKIVDSLQYLLRKLIVKKVEEKIRLSIDIGQFRERRKIELVERAKELAILVKEDGKTQVIPPLNPSERRVVHVALQTDKDIRSRSVGDGIFKKILIYKPGKGKKPGGNKRGGRGRRGKPSKKTQQQNSES